MDSEEVLKRRIKELSAIGSDPEGGMIHSLHIDSQLAAQKYMQSQTEAFGLETQFDEVGNLLCRVVGTGSPQETILTELHIDAVVNGGTLGGRHGVIASMTTVQYLLDKYGKPRRSLEVLSVAEEKGSRSPTVFWGSKNIVGEAKYEEVVDISDNEGKEFADEIRRQGSNFRQGQTRRGDIKVFVEIHIEQGNILESEKLQVGVIHNIVGQRYCIVNPKGQVNRISTTPVSYRYDTVHGFVKICAETTDRTNEIGNPLVSAFGKIVPKPNTVNVAPGEVGFTIDCRHTDAVFLRYLTGRSEERMKTITRELSLTTAIDRWMDEAPVPMNQAVIEVTEQKTKEGKYQYRMIHNGAGHGSQIIAPHYLTVMTFVPSIGGVSHNSAEATVFSDLVEDVKSLADTLCELTYK